jgi:hypothetical protein
METLTADKLAKILHEPKRFLLQRVLRTVGQDMAADILVTTLQCEANGGMLTKDGTRRRTPGGTFFWLLRDRVTGTARQQLFPPRSERNRRKARAGRPRRRPHVEPQALTWEDAKTLIQVLATASIGEAHRMKLTLIGRPGGKVATRNQCVVFRMHGKAPSGLPKGLPPVPKETPLTWTVFVALRQWNRVKDSVTTDQNDQLIIEGYPAREDNQLVLLAQNCTTVAMQRAQKAAQGPPATS